ncbi:hypothetical protein ACFQE7_23105 [Nonomuraea ferruginea]|jgi:hypothetical protein
MELSRRSTAASVALGLDVSYARAERVWRVSPSISFITWFADVAK